MTVVSTQVEQGIAILTIDNPPVNMGNAALRRDLLEAVEGLRDREDIRGAVLASARDHFYSGSDIKEFDGEVARPLLTEVIRVIDELEIPFVAALNGMTLGGGLEVALGCDVRLAEPRARLGLPETTLGMLPGAGGTVRLPRLVGVPLAIDMISSGRAVGADEALAAGLIDEIVERDQLLEAAVARAQTAAKRRIRVGQAPAATDEDIASAVERASRKGRARPNVTRAVELIRAGVEIDPDEALTRERAAFDELRVGAEARNLRYLFFAKRAAAKDLAVAAEARPIRKVGIGGAGTMGSGIAASLLAAGVDVVLFDLDTPALERAASALAVRAATEKRWGEVTLTSDVAEFVACDVVVDAVFEEMDVKIGFLRSVEDVVGEDVVLASNTSYLDLDEIGDALTSPGRLVGLHFFAPADRNPLIEVVRTARSSDSTLAAAGAIVKKLGRTGISARVGEGFVANCVHSDYRGQAEMLVEDGASPREVDDAMIALGMPMGPFAVGDMSGLDIAWARRKRLASTRDPQQRYVAIPDALCESGRLGRKTGAGWYSYADGAQGVDDPTVTAIIESARAAKGIVPRDVTAAEIQQRILCAMLSAAADVVDADVARRASDVDVALTEGFGFPKWLGGPVRLCAAQSPEWLIDGLSAVYTSEPIGFSDLEPAGRGVLPEHVSAVLESVR